MKPKNTYIYAVYCRFNGKPAGFVGYFRTKEAAQRAASSQTIPAIVKREAAPVEWVRDNIK